MSPDPGLTQYQQDLWGMGHFGRVQIYQMGMDKLIRDVENLEANWDKESRGVLAEGAKLFKEAAQERSPYLYGVLRGAHFSETGDSAEGQYGLVSISDAWHHVLGGYASDYGPKIHADDRPWFGWTIEQEGSRIMAEIGAEIADIYGKNLPGNTISIIF